MGASNRSQHERDSRKAALFVCRNAINTALPEKSGRAVGGNGEPSVYLYFFLVIRRMV